MFLFFSMSKMLVLKIRVVYKAGMKSLDREPGASDMTNKYLKD